MKRFIEVTTTCPKSHHMQKTLLINIDYIESIGNCGNYGIVTTPSQVILTQETCEELLSMISKAAI
jgi:hypothetical protein